jgi:hypothetical protein
MQVGKNARSIFSNKRALPPTSRFAQFEELAQSARLLAFIKTKN